MYHARAQYKAAQGIVGFLPEPEDKIRIAIDKFYVKQGKYTKENFESGEIYPPPEKITEQQSQELINAVLEDSILVYDSNLAEEGSKLLRCLEALQAIKLAERCKNSRELWLKTYTLIYDWEWQMYLKYEKWETYYVLRDTDIFQRKSARLNQCVFLSLDLLSRYSKSEDYKWT